MADITPTPDYYDYSLPPGHLLYETTVHPNPPMDYDHRMEEGPNGPLVVVASLRLLYVSAFSVALLGLPLNLAVIAQAALFGRRRKRRPPAGHRAQILGLAVTHLARCLLLPLSLLSALRSFSWESGEAACKLASYGAFVDMFSAALIVTFWHASAARCCRRVPEKRRLLGFGPVLLSWVLGAVLATPSWLTMELQENPGSIGTKFCTESPGSAVAVAASRVLFGLAFPLVVIVASRSKRRGRNDSVQTPPPPPSPPPEREVVVETRDSPALWPVTVGHFVCWSPVLLLSLLKVTAGQEVVSSPYALPLCTVLHVFNGCVFCPLLCLWKGREEEEEGVDRTRTTSANKDEQERDTPL